MTSGRARQCKIPIDKIMEHLKNIFDENNTKIRDNYETRPVKPDIVITVDEIKSEIRKINLDTSPGPDRILIRTVRELNVYDAITALCNIMLNTAYVPSSLRKGRLVLIDKGGDSDDISNWRPITIYSMIRRIIERALEKKLCTQVDINSNQRGFIKGLPGCHINTRLVNGCLLDAKHKKKNCVVTFLDISKAFDKIGHDHINLSLIA